MQKFNYVANHNSGAKNQGSCYQKNAGDYGEKIASGYLLAHGYNIVDTKYAIFGGEIDIIAYKPYNLPNSSDNISGTAGKLNNVKNKNTIANTPNIAQFQKFAYPVSRNGKAQGTLVFVEVKTLPHGNMDILEKVMGYKKQMAVSKTAKIFLLHNRQYSDCKIRFDVIVIDMPGLPKVYHIKNAFDYVGDLAL